HPGRGHHLRERRAAHPGRPGPRRGVEALPAVRPPHLRRRPARAGGAVRIRRGGGGPDAPGASLADVGRADRAGGHPPAVRVRALEPLRSAAERCLDWVDRRGARDGDGFQEYAPRTPRGYRNQSWRDAHDGVLDETGAFPDLPHGTSEMQAYVYGAKTRIAPLFEAWGDHARAAQLMTEAEALRRKFIEVFWLDASGELAFAIDGKKRAIPTVASDSGHCLWMGILDGERGRAAGRRLMQPDMFTGWGLRVLSDHHPSYDPHSYQRGSVWPHDSVIAAAGMRRYG